MSDSLNGRCPKALRQAFRTLIGGLLYLAICLPALVQACGEEGQRPCPFWVRIPSCFDNLVESGGRCVHPPCGRTGETACTIPVRIPSCDTGLIEVSGHCVPPSHCGSEHERPCFIWKKPPRVATQTWLKFHWASLASIRRVAAKEKGHAMPGNGYHRATRVWLKTRAVVPLQHRAPVKANGHASFGKNHHLAVSRIWSRGHWV